MTDTPNSMCSANVEGTASPLATFALVAYNQEAFVREAVRAALEQTYRPLEIILSDDASTDKTFEIMEDEARFCPRDVHLILNRNERNLGIGNHINKIVDMSGGEFLVLAAGDDVSLPHRTQISVEAFLADDCKRPALHGTVTHVDAAGRVLLDRWNSFRSYIDAPESVLANDACLTGCSVVVRRLLYTDFPELGADVVNEDKITAFRCSFFGGAIYVDEPLVRYREGVGVATLQGELLRGREDPEREARYIRTRLIRRFAVLKQMRVDIESNALAGRVSPELRCRIDEDTASLGKILKFVDAPRLRALPELLGAVGVSRETLKIATLFLAPGLFRRYRLFRKLRRKAIG